MHKCDEVPMKFFLPPLSVGRNDGFTEDNDIFSRKEFGISLANVVKSTDSELVIAIDAKWGEGKTTFMHQWRGMLSSNDYNIDSIYFDAFSNDFHEDAFIALATEIYEYIYTSKNDDPQDATIWENRAKYLSSGAKKWAKIALRAGLGIGVRAFSGGLLSSEDLCNEVSNAYEAGKQELEKECLKSTTKSIENRIEKYFEEQIEYKQGMNDFRNALAKFAQDINAANSSPLVFIVDELDRCRPDFALELIEKIKHIFSVRGIVFVLVYNSAQLEGQIECRYGAGVDAKAYLSKFINICVSLPREFISTKDGHSPDDTRTYVNKLIELHGFPSGAIPLDTLEAFSYIAYRHSLSLRDIERIFSYLALYFASRGEETLYLGNIVLGLCILRVKNEKLYKAVVSGRQCYSELAKYFDFTEYQDRNTIVNSLKSFISEWRICADTQNGLSDDLKQFMFHKGWNMMRRDELIKPVIKTFKLFLLQ